MEDSFDEKLAHYIEIGAIEAAGIDESGEFIFAINESAQELAPELWEAHMHFVDQSLIELYEAGYLKVDYNEDLEATISLSPEGFEIAKARGIIPMDMPEIPND
jgi:hypothetical protein